MNNNNYGNNIARVVFMDMINFSKHLKQNCITTYTIVLYIILVSILYN